MTPKSSRKMMAANPKFDIKTATDTALTFSINPALHYHTEGLFLSIHS